MIGGVVRGGRRYGGNRHCGRDFFWVVGGDVVVVGVVGSGSVVVW